MKHSINHQRTKAFVIFLALCFAVPFLQAQDITGQWNGMLNIPGMKLRIVFHITKTGETYTSTMVSPDQSPTGIPVTATTFADSKLSLTISGMYHRIDCRICHYRTDLFASRIKRFG